jgi:SOS response regulatory protein OraA/RecX
MSYPDHSESRLEREVEELTKSIAEKDAEIANLQTRCALLEQLLGECVRNKYYDDKACSPSWLEEAVHSDRRGACRTSRQVASHIWRCNRRGLRRIRQP